LDDEMVLYQAEAGQAYVLNRSAAYVWALCDGTRPAAALARALARAYGLGAAQARADVRELLDGLAAAGLLVPGRA